jgi:hypothetical protein
MRDGGMSVDVNHEQRLRELQEQLRHAQTITPKLMEYLIARACLRFQAHRDRKGKSHSPDRIRSLR